MQNSISKSIIFKTAWQLFKSSIYSTFSEALKAAWKEIKLRASLKSKKVAITFRKASGEITTRIATLSDKFFDYKSSSKGTQKAGLIKFFSITDNGFRACRIERLISFKTA